MIELLKYIKNITIRREWMYYNYIDNPSMWDFDGSYYEYRFCSKTKKLQKFVSHCYGLNPPQYEGNWSTVKGKPCFKKNEKGEWYIYKVKNFV